MGNRCVITTELLGEDKENVKNSCRTGVYLHWNGGLNDVMAFLRYCQERDFRPPEEDDYGWARLCQIIGNYIGGGLSIGIGPCRTLDCTSDNGTYFIKDWKIVGRAFADWDEEYNEQHVLDMVREIDACQPERDRLW